LPRDLAGWQVGNARTALPQSDKGRASSEDLNPCPIRVEANNSDLDVGVPLHCLRGKVALTVQCDWSFGYKVAVKPLSEIIERSITFNVHRSSAKLNRTPTPPFPKCRLGESYLRQNKAVSVFSAPSVGLERLFLTCSSGHGTSNTLGYINTTRML
jgi:hypothetical protein